MVSWVWILVAIAGVLAVEFATASVVSFRREIRSRGGELARSAARVAMTYPRRSVRRWLWLRVARWANRKGQQA